jgi:hypothetical protein
VRVRKGVIVIEKKGYMAILWVRKDASLLRESGT